MNGPVHSRLVQIVVPRARNIQLRFFLRACCSAFLMFLPSMVLASLDMNISPPHRPVCCRIEGILNHIDPSGRIMRQMLLDPERLMTDGVA